jgi:phospholipid/cholesterol/gamma-HCH transport system substrate-binding protein
MTDTRDDFTATEIKAGALVLASALILVGFIVTIRGCRLNEPQTHVLHASFTDVGGLDAGAAVRFGGVQVGKVTAVGLDPDDPVRIRVTAKVRADVPVNRASVASIEQLSLTAEKHLEISTGDGASERLPDGATVPSTGVASGLFDVPDVDGVISRLEGLLDDVDTLLGVDRAQRAQAAGGPEFVDFARLAATVESALQATTDAVTSLRGFVDPDTGSAREVVDKLVALEQAAAELLAEMQRAIADNREPLGQVVDNLARLTSTASSRLDELSAVLARGLESLADAGANTNHLVDRQTPAIDEILANLAQASRNLRELSQTLADNPAALIRGVDPPGRTSGGRR